MDPKGLELFQGSHPAIIQEWLESDAEKELVLDPTYKITRKERKYRILIMLEKIFSLDLSKRHFKAVK